MTESILVSNFSSSPFGRYPSDSAHNGAAFRRERLLPALAKGGVVEVDMDTKMARGYEYGSSFLHEAFGGLVLHEGWTYDGLKAVLKIKTKHLDVEEEVWEYISHPEDYI